MIFAALMTLLTAYIAWQASLHTVSRTAKFSVYLFSLAIVYYLWS